MLLNTDDDDGDEKEEWDKDTDEDTEDDEDGGIRAVVVGIVWIALFCSVLGGVSFDSDIFV